MLATSSGNTDLYLYDGIHNPIGLSSSFQTTAAAFRYDPYGGVTTTNNSSYSTSYENPYTFGEGLLDRATSEIKFGQRFYNPTTGNWTQQDALNAPLDPNTANRYQYAADNPINALDPTGRSLSDYTNSCAAGAGTALLVGAATGGDEGPQVLATAVGGCAEGLIVQWANDASHSLLGTASGFAKDVIDVFS